MLQHGGWGGISQQHDLQSALTLPQLSPVAAAVWHFASPRLPLALGWQPASPAAALLRCWEMLRLEARRGMGWGARLPALGSFVMPDPSTLLEGRWERGLVPLGP